MKNKGYRISPVEVKMSKICINCGGILDDGLHFCPGCGRKIEIIREDRRMQCKNCGCKLSPFFNFCPKCGTPFGSAALVLSQGKAFKDYTDFNLIRDAAAELIGKSNGHSVSIKSCRIIGKSYTEDNCGAGQWIYYMVAEISDSEAENRRYGILLWNPKRMGKNISYHYLSSAIECGDMNTDEIKELLWDSVENNCGCIC